MSEVRHKAAQNQTQGIAIFGQIFVLLRQDTMGTANQQTGVLLCGSNCLCIQKREQKPHIKISAHPEIIMEKYRQSLSLNTYKIS